VTARTAATIVVSAQRATSGQRWRVNASPSNAPENESHA
jgi:hypothetical protein